MAMHTVALCTLPSVQRRGRQATSLPSWRRRRWSGQGELTSALSSVHVLGWCWCLGQCTYILLSKGLMLYRMYTYDYDIRTYTYTYAYVHMYVHTYIHDHRTQSLCTCVRTYVSVLSTCVVVSLLLCRVESERAQVLSMLNSSLKAKEQVQHQTASDSDLLKEIRSLREEVSG